MTRLSSVLSSSILKRKASNASSNCVTSTITTRRYSPLTRCCCNRQRIRQNSNLQTRREWPSICSKTSGRNRKWLMRSSLLWKRTNASKIRIWRLLIRGKGYEKGNTWIRIWGLTVKKCFSRQASLRTASSSSRLWSARTESTTLSIWLTAYR